MLCIVIPQIRREDKARPFKEYKEPQPGDTVSGNLIIVVGSAGENSPFAKKAQVIARKNHISPEIIDKNTPRAEWLWAQGQSMGLFPNMPHFPMFGAAAFATDTKGNVIGACISLEEAELLDLMDKMREESPMGYDAHNGPFLREMANRQAPQ